MKLRKIFLSFPVVSLIMSVVTFVAAASVPLNKDLGATYQPIVKELIQLLEGYIRISQMP